MITLTGFGFDQPHLSGSGGMGSGGRCGAAGEPR